MALRSSRNFFQGHVPENDVVHGDVRSDVRRQRSEPAAVVRSRHRRRALAVLIDADRIALRVGDNDVLEDHAAHRARLLLLELDVAAECRADRRAVPEGDIPLRASLVSFLQGGAKGAL